MNVNRIQRLTAETTLEWLRPGAVFSPTGGPSSLDKSEFTLLFSTAIELHVK